MQGHSEENPFENRKVAEEWIASVEGEKGLLRDRELYPRLAQWAQQAQPRQIVEIGSGQGICSEHINASESRYVGIEPSQLLVERAQKLYALPNRRFVRGNAYELPIADASTDAAFSVNVWFHLENINQASQELSRILKSGGKFLIE